MSDEACDLLDQAHKNRVLAKRSRGLASGLSFDDQTKLERYANELEAQAIELERLAELRETKPGGDA